jgi:ribonuclease P/MRP protein subunit POP5
MKGKPLLPTLRTKKRYVAYEVISQNDVPIQNTFASISNSFKECFGIFGLGNAGLIDTKIYNNLSKKGLLKINHKYVDQLKASMALITNINDTKVIVHAIGISGILKKAKIKYMA